MFSVSFSWTVPPSGYWAAPSAPMSVPCCSASCATFFTKSWNSSFLATKSVSEFTSTTAPRLPSTATPTRPSDAVRPAFLAAADRPLARSQSMAASMSPLVSASAFLQSIMPALVRSRSSFTDAAVISAISSFLLYEIPGASRLISNVVIGRSGFQRRFHGRLGHLADVLAASCSVAGTALADRLRDGVRVEADRAAGVVIARDREGDAARVAVRIEDRHDRDAQRVGFLDRELFLVGVDHEHDVRKPAHVADSAEALLELVALAGELEHFLLRKAGSVARQLLLEA